MGTNANLKRWDSRSGFEGYYKDLQNYVRISDRRDGTGNVMTFTDSPGERSFRAYQVRVATPQESILTIR